MAKRALKGARKNARQAGSAAAREQAAESRQFPSTSPENRDRQRETGVEQSQAERYPGSPERQKAREKATQAPRRAAKNGDAPLTVDDIVPQTQLATTAFGQLDHAAMNHPRSEHDHRPGEARGSVEGPAPRDLSEVEDDGVILEQIRKEDKADALYSMRRREREGQAREWVINALNARLVEVQGAPIIPE